MNFQPIGISLREEGRRQDVHLCEVENEQPDLVDMRVEVCPKGERLRKE